MTARAPLEMDRQTGRQTDRQTDGQRVAALDVASGHVDRPRLGRGSSPAAAGEAAAAIGDGDPESEKAARELGRTQSSIY